MHCYGAACSTSHFLYFVSINIYNISHDLKLDAIIAFGLCSWPHAIQWLTISICLLLLKAMVSNPGRTLSHGLVYCCHYHALDLEYLRYSQFLSTTRVEEVTNSDRDSGFRSQSLVTRQQSRPQSLRYFRPAAFFYVQLVSWINCQVLATLSSCGSQY